MKLGIFSVLLAISLVVSLLATTNQAFAGVHSLGTHEHGSVKLSLAVEAAIMEVDFDGPSESLIGFERAPKSDKEKAIYNGTKNLWEKKLLTVITPEATLGCKLSESSFTQRVEGSHADIEAKAKIVCEKNLAGSSVKIALIKVFSHIKKLKVDILSATSRSVDITKAEQIIKL